MSILDGAEPFHSFKGSKGSKGSKGKRGNKINKDNDSQADTSSVIDICLQQRVQGT